MSQLFVVLGTVRPRHLNAARIWKECVLLEIEQADLHAKDVLYHTSCCKAYTSQRALELLLKKEEADEESFYRPHAKAFQTLVKLQYLRIRIL